ncbi:GntR family transcriptional regulator [Sphingopyxis sp. GW247-27LB]|uniref:GntR family transcriptional regulator n=1 Tax=Sphingopyxis sp. GW247-27LB TaxID=2012632 RepID=UPI000BA79624|nr:GntR family transcriptional regulator [Sphingopyxis sp. GW247-27LB]PAL23144.1 GntR family transcriptional regulator [Sphingopyxis sp. GW247-27LB]
MSRASDLAHSMIKEKILSGELAGGAPVTEASLSKLCGISRTPVREALRKLEAELLVIRTDTNRTMIAHWSHDDVIESFELRALLEGRAAYRAAARISDVDIERLRVANRRICQAIDKPSVDTDAFLDANHEFHTIFHRAAGSRHIASLLNGLIERPVISRTVHQYSREELRRSYDDHEQIIDSLARGDSIMAETLLRSHIMRAYHAFVEPSPDLSQVQEIEREQ